MDPLKEAIKKLGTDRATFEKIAQKVLKDHPELREVFSQKVKDKGFNEAIAEVEQELKDILNHAKSPNVR